MGLGTSVPTGPRKARPAAAGRKGVAAPIEDDEPETNPIVDIVLGAVVHTGYSLRTAFRRARASHAERRAAEAAAWRDDEVEPSLDGHAPVVERREPSVAPSPRRIHAPVEPAFDAEPEISPRINARPSYDDTELDYPDEAEDDMPFVADVPAAPVASHQQRGDSRFHPVDPAKPRVAAPGAASGARPAHDARGPGLVPRRTRRLRAAAAEPAVRAQAPGPLARACARAARSHGAPA